MSEAVLATTAPAQLAIPANPGGRAPSVLLDQKPAAALARIGASIFAAIGKPFRLGNTVLVGRHAQVKELLARDLEFQIAPVNAARMEAVNGAFILGMDRGDILVRERGGLYRALGAVDLESLREAVAKDAAGRVETAFGNRIDVVGGYARPIAANTARLLFGASGPDQATFQDAARAIFAHTFLNLRGHAATEARARRAGAMMKLWLGDEIATRRASGIRRPDLMGRLIEDDTLDDDTIRRSLGGMLVGSIDTTATAVAKIVAVIGKDPRLAAGIAADVDDPRRLRGWCWEALRRWPHNPILIRHAAAATMLCGTEIRPGDKVIAWIQAAMLDKSAFPAPRDLRPDRPAEAYLHFGGGLHPCAGRAVNAFQIPILVGSLVRRGIKSVNPIRWAGPFPDQLELRFER